MRENSIEYQVSSGMISNEKFLEEIRQYSGQFPTITNNKRKTMYNIPAAFDIEVTSFDFDGEKNAIMYEWTLGLLNWVTYGRTWQQLINLLDSISGILQTEYANLIVYVHNLPYEWQFMRNRFKWQKVFFLDARKPVYAITKSGIEFRCSLKLSNKSLENTAKDLRKYPIEKMAGDLDYSLLRHDKTILTEKELKYCENDVRVILSYIQEKIEQDGDISKIPLTNTGYVRNYCRKACFERRRKYRDLMEELTLDADEYIELKEAFQGGFTHANARKVDKIQYNVASYDFTSSYPSVMIAEKYPMGKAKRIGEATLVDLKKYSKSNCCLFRCKITYLISTTEIEHPLSSSKCRKLSEVAEDNGRIVTASYLETTMTEQDFFILEKFYSWDKFEIFDLILYNKGYLPNPFVKAIIYMYKRKTELKDVEGEEINYMILKNMLNSAYGMTVTDIVREIYEFSEDIGYVEKTSKMTKEEYRAELEAQIEQYNTSVKRFLFYPWGVWVTAYARYNLFTGIYACGSDYIYSDTDSIKLTNPEKHIDYFQEYNNLVSLKLKESCRARTINYEELTPCNKYGKNKPIGIWDYEGTYSRFKTLGAKRYLIEENGKFKLTVAGVNKKMAMKYIEDNFQDPFNAFNSNLVIPKDNSGRNVLTYIDFIQSGTITDYTGIESKFFEYSSIHMESTSYSFHRSDAFRDYLLGIFVKEESW